MPEERYEVRIVADTHGFRLAVNGAQHDLSQLGANAKKAGGHIDEAGKHAAHAHKSFLGISHAIKSVGSAFAGLFVAEKGIELLKESGKEAMANQVAMTRLSQSVKNAGLSWRVHGKAIEEVIDKQVKLTGFTKTQTANALAALETRTHSTSKSLHLLGVAQDVARGRGIELSRATMMVMRASLGNAAALTRLGIQMPKVTAHVDALKAAHDRASIAGHKFSKAEMVAYHASLQNAKALDKHATALAAVRKLHETYAGQSKAFSNTAAGAIARMGEQWNEAKVAIGQRLLPVVAKLGGWLANTIPEAVQRVSKFWHEHSAVLAAVVKGVLVFGGALVVIKQGIAAVRAVQLAWNAAMAMNPLGLIVIAIALVVAGLYELYTHSKTAHKIMDQAFKAIKNAAMVAFGWIKQNVVPIVKRVFQEAVDLVKRAVGYLRAHWDAIKGAAKATLAWLVQNVVPTLKTIMTDAVKAFEFLRHHVDTVLRIARHLWEEFGGTIMRVLKLAVGYITRSMHNIKRVIEGVFKIIHGVITGNWGEAWSGVKRILSAAWDQIKNVLNTFPKILLALLKAAGKAMWDGIKIGMGKLVDLGSWLWGKIQGGLTGLVGLGRDALAAVGKAMYDGVIGALGGLDSAIAGLMKSAINGAIGILNAGFNALVDHWPNIPGAPGPPFSHNPIPTVHTGAIVSGAYGVDDTPVLVTGQEAILNPRQIAMVGKERVMGALAATGAPTITRGGRYAGGGKGTEVATAISAAKSQLGVPYSWGGGGPGGPSYGIAQGSGIRGFDCSSLVQYAYSKAGVSLGRTTNAQATGHRVPTSSLQPGDILFYNGFKHEALYLGGGQVIEAPHTGDVVKYASSSMDGGIIAAVRPVSTPQTGTRAATDPGVGKWMASAEKFVQTHLALPKGQNPLAGMRYAIRKLLADGKHLRPGSAQAKRFAVDVKSLGRLGAQVEAAIKRRPWIKPPKVKKPPKPKGSGADGILGTADDTGTGAAGGPSADQQAQYDALLADYTNAWKSAEVNAAVLTAGIGTGLGLGAMPTGGVDPGGYDDQFHGWGAGGASSGGGGMATGGGGGGGSVDDPAARVAAAQAAYHEASMRASGGPGANPRVTGRAKPPKGAHAAGGAHVTVHVNTLHPGDPATLKAIHHAATRGAHHAGYRRSSHVRLGH